MVSPSFFRGQIIALVSQYLISPPLARWCKDTFPFLQCFAKAAMYNFYLEQLL